MKIAILGGSDARMESDDYELAFRLATCLARAGHQIMTAGFAGIASAVAAGARSVGQVPKVLLDVGQVQTCHFYEEEVREDGYFINLQAIVMQPEAYVFFPGNQGTRIQLQALLHMMDKGCVDAGRPIIICEDHGLILYRLATVFMEQGRSAPQIVILLTRDLAKICEKLDHNQVAQGA